jgi:hypothetical protein
MALPSPDAAAQRFEQARNRTEERGFAAAVRTDQNGHFTGGDGQADAINNHC